MYKCLKRGRWLFCGLFFSTFVLAQDPFQLAIVAFQERNFGKVLSLLSSVSTEQEHSANFHGLRAMALTELERYDEALEANRKAQKLSPQNPNYFYNAGLIHVKREDFIEAEKVFRDAIDRFPTSSAPYEGLGDALFEQNRLKEAEKYLRKAIELDPDSGSAYVLLAKLFYAIGDERLLGWSASKAVRLVPQQYLACYYYGKWLLEYRQNIGLARQYIQRSVGLSPGFTEGLKALASILSRQGLWKQAAQAYKKAIGAEPEDAQNYYLLAIVYRRLGQNKKAHRAIYEYQKRTKNKNGSQ